LGSLIEAHGYDKTLEWCRGFVANLARPPQGGDTDQIKAVAAGVGDVAISNSYYLGRLIGSDKPEDKAVAEKVGIFFPNQGDRGTHVNVSGVGLLAHAPNRANAIKLIEYLVSPEAQRYLAEVNFEYPANPSVPPEFGGRRLGPVQAGHAQRRGLCAAQRRGAQARGSVRLEVRASAAVPAHVRAAAIQHPAEEDDGGEARHHDHERGQGGRVEPLGTGEVIGLDGERVEVERSEDQGGRQLLHGVDEDEEECREQARPQEAANGPAGRR
jgi:hypothetical protein